MASPFPANAILIFEVPTDEFVTDELGNLKPKIREESVKAYLTADSRSDSMASKRPRDDLHIGVDESEELMKGYAVEPQFLPKGVRRARATISGVEGTLALILITPSPFVEIIKEAIGQEVVGIFKRQL